MDLAVFVHAGIDVFQPIRTLFRIIEVLCKGMPPRFLAGPQVGDEDLADRQPFAQFVDEEQFMVIAGADVGGQFHELVDLSSARASCFSLYW